MTTPKERAQKELADLKEKADKLAEFLKKGKPAFISEHAWQLNKDQWDVMMQYSRILEEKINLM